MSEYWPFIVIGVVAAVLLVRSIQVSRRRNLEQKQALALVGFQPCPDRKAWLEETVARIENNSEYSYEVREPKRLPGEPSVYHYIKRCEGYADDSPLAEDEVLFPLKRGSAAGLVLIVKPSSLPSGRASRLMGAIATGPWDVQPDDLQRIEIPPPLKDTNVVGALGPQGANLYDLVDSDTLTVVQGLGDAGGIVVRFRDSWCSVAGGSAHLPFRVDEVVARIRPLVRK